MRIWIWLSDILTTIKYYYNVVARGCISSEPLLPPLTELTVNSTLFQYCPTRKRRGFIEEFVERKCIKKRLREGYFGTIQLIKLRSVVNRILYLPYNRRNDSNIS
jgi:hypothetical protein